MALIGKNVKTFLIALVAVPAVLAVTAFAASGAMEYLRVHPVLSALDAPSSVEIYAIAPKNITDRADNTFHDVPVIGHASLQGEQVVKATEAYRRALASHSLFMRTVSACVYTPAYALRVVSKDDTYDFLLSDTCNHLDIFRNDDKILSIDDASGKPQEFDALLAESGF